MVENMSTVLIVDDEEFFLSTLSYGLTKLIKNIKVITANNGKQAVDLLAKEKIDLVVTDLKMPEMDGYQLLNYMMINYKSTPVVVMTSFCSPEVEAEITAFGTIGLIEKPIDLPLFANIIQEALLHTTRT